MTLKPNRESERMIGLCEFIDRKLSGKLPDGYMMIDNDCWTYCISADEQFDVDITEPALLDGLTALGVKWERV